MVVLNNYFSRTMILIFTVGDVKQLKVVVMTLEKQYHVDNG